MMGFAVLSHNTGAVDSQHYMLAAQCHIMHQLVITTL